MQTAVISRDSEKLLSSWNMSFSRHKGMVGCTAKLTTLDSIKLQTRWVPAHVEVESGFHLYFNLPGLKIQSYEILRKDGNREWKKTWVQLSLSVQVHWHQSLLHFRMAEREPVPLLRSPSSIASWQPLLSCIYTAASVHLRSARLQWICQLSPLTLLWFTSQSWFRSEETNCQLKPNEICSS